MKKLFLLFVLLVFCGASTFAAWDDPYLVGKPTSGNLLMSNGKGGIKDSDLSYAAIMRTNQTGDVSINDAQFGVTYTTNLNATLTLADSDITSVNGLYTRTYPDVEGYPYFVNDSSSYKIYWDAEEGGSTNDRYVIHDASDSYYFVGSTAGVTNLESVVWEGLSGEYFTPPDEMLSAYGDVVTTSSTLDLSGVSAYVADATEPQSPTSLQQLDLGGTDDDSVVQYGSLAEWAVDPSDFVQVGATNTVSLAPYFIDGSHTMQTDGILLSQVGGYPNSVIFTPVSSAQTAWYLLPKNTVSYEVNGMFEDPGASTTSGTRLCCYLSYVDYGSLVQTNSVLITLINATNLTFTVSGTVPAAYGAADVTWLKIKNFAPTSPMTNQVSVYLHPVTAQVVE